MKQVTSLISSKGYPPLRVKYTVAILLYTNMLSRHIASTIDPITQKGPRVFLYNLSLSCPINPLGEPTKVFNLSFSTGQC